MVKKLNILKKKDYKNKNQPFMPDKNQIREINLDPEALA